MNANIRIGKVFGIPIGLHSSWFLVFGLVLISLSTGYFPQEYPQLSLITNIILAVVTTILFFGSVLLHELGHSILAIRSGIPVKGITLFIFGGVAQITREPNSPGVEFRVAIAGPLTSLSLAGFFGLAYLLDHQIPYLAAPSIYLARINLMLALFNMIPGFPLDGGRVLRALVWRFTGNFRRATQFASTSGQLVAFGFIGFGIFTVFTGNFMNGLWLAFIGWFLQNAASSAAYQVNFRERLRGISVLQAMDRGCPEISGLLSLNQIVQDFVLGRGQHTFFVSDADGKTVGMVTLQDITRIPKIQWRFVTAERVMIPINRLLKFESSDDLLATLQAMDEANIIEAPVVFQDQLVGVISREQARRYLRLRTDLGI